MKKVLAICGGLAAAALACWLFIEVFSGRLILSQSFAIGPLTVRYYGLILGFAVLAGYFVARANAWRFGLSKEEADRAAFWGVLAGLVGARLYFVFFEWKYFAQNPNEIWQVWSGGLSIYGAIISGLAFLWAWTRRKIYSSWQILDLAALGLPLAQAIGRLGNFFNYEAYGRATDLPWKMFVPEEYRADSAAYYHPVFLYESLLNLVLFFALIKMRGRVRPGRLALAYLAGYAAIRFCLEPLRMDSVFIGSFRVDQVISLVIFLAAVFTFWTTSRRTS